MVTIIVVGIVMAFFTGLLFITKPKRSVKDKFITAFMIALIAPMIEKLILERVLPIPYFRFSIFSGIVLSFGPFLYLYTQAEIKESFRFSIRNLIHFIPFGISVPLLLIFNWLKKPQYAISNIDSIPNIHWILNILVVISLLAYTVVIFLLLKKHRQHIGEYFSVVSIGITLKWLNWVTISFFVSYLTVVVLTLLGMSLLWVPDLGTVMFIIAFSFAVIKQPDLFPVLEVVPYSEKKDEFEKVEELEKSEDKRYVKSGLKDAQIQEVLPRLEVVMNHDKLFLDPDLTIVDLAQQLNISRHHLTQIINEVYKKNFYQYINEYRINEVKRKIADEKFNDHSFLMIALDSGFNSKSSFNTTFKKITNYTPTQYKKMVQP